MSTDKETRQGQLRSQNLDEACILKTLGVPIEKTLVYIFSKTQLFEVPLRISDKSILPKPVIKSKKHAEEKNKKCDCLKTILSCIWFLTRQEIYFLAKKRD